MTEDIDDCYPVVVDGAERSVRQNCDADELDEFWGGDTEVQSTLLRGDLPLDRQEPEEGGARPCDGGPLAAPQRGG